MGIHGIYKEIGAGRRIALSKYSVEHYVKHSRPLRLAIDISIWLFQIQSGKGGSNPALRTFYYRLLRLLSLNIHPVFVFDGPNKPPFKRNKRVGGPNVKVSSIPEFLAKQLLKQFGFPMHLAPGEAEAECALLQREGLVDAVLSEDVDTLMFGSGTTMRSWTPEAKSSKVPTHVNIYDSQATKDGSGLDREGMILIALMSGGDYIPEGIPGCGPKTACEAARAGFGEELCKLKKRDEAGFDEWRERLKHELWTNDSKFFRTRRRLDIPNDFPNREVLGYYTNPCVSSAERIEGLRETLKWDQTIDFQSLRSFTADAFDWVCISGAKKFIRNLAPAILVRELRLRAEHGANDGGNLDIQAAAESRLVAAIHGKRMHPSTDNMPELRITVVGTNIVDIDLSQEPPDEDIAGQSNDLDSDAPEDEAGEIESECPSSPKKRGPSKYDPEVGEKIWVMDTFVRHGAPLKVQDWEASFKDPKQYLAQKRAARDAAKQRKATGGMPRGALDPFTKITKSSVTRLVRSKGDGHAVLDSVDLSAPSSSAPAAACSLPAARPVEEERRPGKHDQRSKGVLDELDLSQINHSARQVAGSRKRTSDEATLTMKHTRTQSETPKANRMRQPTIIDLISPPTTPEKAKQPASHPTNRRLDFSTGQLTEKIGDEIPPLPDTVTKRRKRSPLKRHETAPAALEEFLPGSRCNNIALAIPNDGPDVDEVDLSLPLLESRPRAPIHEATHAIVITTDQTGLGKSFVEAAAKNIPAVAVAAAPRPASVMEAFARRAPATEQTVQKLVKRHYQLRESLEGAWKEVEVEIEVGLTSPGTTTKGVMSAFARPTASFANDPGARGPRVSGKEKTGSRTRWRQSEVEVVDMTCD